MKLIFTLFIFLYYGNYFAIAQQNPKVKDSIKMYRSIEKYAKKSKFRKFVYGMIFEPVSKQVIKQNNFQKDLKSINYTKVEGKIIRKIEIITLKPFGYSEIDTTQNRQRF